VNHSFRTVAIGRNECWHTGFCPPHRISSIKLRRIVVLQEPRRMESDVKELTTYCVIGEMLPFREARRCEFEAAQILRVSPRGV
jgi:hypothetical protein